MSNAVPFTVNTLQITPASPASGVAGTSVTITGTAPIRRRSLAGRIGDSNEILSIGQFRFVIERRPLRLPLFHVGERIVRFLLADGQYRNALNSSRRSRICKHW